MTFYLKRALQDVLSPTIPIYPDTSRSNRGKDLCMCGEKIVRMKKYGIQVDPDVTKNYTNFTQVDGPHG